MFWLIENKEQLDIFSNKDIDEVFIEVIPYNNLIHPQLNDVSLIYINPLYKRKGYMLCVCHSETMSLSIDDIKQTLKQYKRIYTRDKKQLLHYLPLKNLFDMNPLPPTYIPKYTQAHNYFYTKHKNRKDINRLVPVTKHYEYCEQMVKDLIPFKWGHKDGNYFNWFNMRTSIVYSAIEQGGIKVDKAKFEEHFHPIDEDYIYTQYNLKTMTSRPSNSFGGINFAALSKKTGCREAFIPRNNIFVDYDVSAYHPTLAGQLVNYKFENEDIHQAFAEMYKVDYKKAKELTFKQLYGGVFEQYKDLEFFQKIEKYVTELSETYNNTGRIEVPGSYLQLEKKELGELKPQKLFNYLLQAFETATNVKLLWDIFILLIGRNTKLVLTVYDSFLFDVDLNEIEVLKEIEDVFKSYDLNVKSKEGTNYENIR